MEKPEIEIGNLLMDWEFSESVFKSLKIDSAVQPDKVVHQLLGCLDNDQLKLFNRNDDKLEGLSEENLL